MGRGSSGGGSRIGSRMGGNMIKSVDSFGRPQYHSGTSKGAKSIGANQLMKNWDKAKASKWMSGWGAAEKKAYQAFTKKGAPYGYSKAKAIKAVNANKKYYDHGGGADIPQF